MLSYNELSILSNFRGSVSFFCDNEMRFRKTIVPNSPVNWVEIATLKKIYYKEDDFNPILLTLLQFAKRLPIEI